MWKSRFNASLMTSLLCSDLLAYSGNCDVSLCSFGSDYGRISELGGLVSTTSAHSAPPSPGARTHTCTPRIVTSYSHSWHPCTPGRLSWALGHLGITSLQLHVLSKLTGVCGLYIMLGARVLDHTALRFLCDMLAFPGVRASTPHSTSSSTEVIQV